MVWDVWRVYGACVARAVSLHNCQRGQDDGVSTLGVEHIWSEDQVMPIHIAHAIPWNGDTVTCATHNKRNEDLVRYKRLSVGR